MFLPGQGLAHGRVHATTGVDGKVELQTHRGVVVPIADVGRVLALAARQLCHGIKRRVMASVRLQDFLAGRLQLCFERLHFGAAQLGPGRPVVQAVGLRVQKFEPGHVKAGQLVNRLIDQHLQLSQRVGHVLPRFELLCHVHVHARLRLVHIGTRARACGKGLACRVKL